jgi:hypothetical protein
MRPITRRSLLKALGIAPPIAAGIAPVGAEASDREPHRDFLEPDHFQTGWFVQTDLYDAGMANWDRVVAYYDLDGELHEYRVTSTGVYIPRF